MTKLELLLSEVLISDPDDQLIAPMGACGYTTLFSYISADFAVLKLAVQIDPSPDRVLDWYTSVGIRELGGFTAEVLVAMGRAEFVVNFLKSIVERDKNE